MAKTHISLPADEGPHADPVEWWYITAQGKSHDGREYALMCALFKAGVFGLTDVYFAHWFVSDIGKQKFIPHYRVFWHGMDELSFNAHDFRVSSGKTFLMAKSHGNITLETPQFKLELKPDKPVMPAGGTGFVDMVSSTTSYYSLPRLKATGKIMIDKHIIHFDGTAWMDHQWSPMTFNNEHVWTWFSFQLSDKTDVMCFEYGRKKRMRQATVSWPDGTISTSNQVVLTPTAKPWISPDSKANYPLDWEIELPELKITLAAHPKIRKQEMVHGPFRYWEGPLYAHGTIKGKKAEGQGFLEINGQPAGKTPFVLLKRLITRLR